MSKTQGEQLGLTFRPPIIPIGAVDCIGYASGGESDARQRAAGEFFFSARIQLAHCAVDRMRFAERARHGKETPYAIFS